MKTCPICQAATFSDADVCFGCLHRFEDGEPASDPPAQTEKPDSQPPAFFIRLSPASDPSGEIAWTCSVDLAPC